jgi:adenylate cyclase
VAQLDFAEWLSEKSWQQAVRACRIAVILLPVVAIALDAPVLASPEKRGQFVWQMTIAWHVLAIGIASGILLIDRFARRRLRMETLTNASAIAILLMSAWFGVIGWLHVRDFSVYALGTVFVATVLCTPRHIRRPLYFLMVAVISVFVYSQLGNQMETLVYTLSNPLCVAIISWQLDRYAYERNVALFTEMQRADFERERADKVLYNVLPVPVADELKRDGKVNAVKFEGMGVMFTDIVGFTSFSKQLPPDALVFMLNQIFSMFDRLVDKYSLEKIKTIGDAYMVVSYKQTEALALLALEMLAEMKAYNAANAMQLQLRVGLHVGPTVAGVIGVKRFLYDVWGDTVNVASRMESTGEAGQVHVTHAVQAQLADRFVFEPRTPIEVKGQGTMATFFLVDRRESARPASNVAAFAAA